MYAQITITIPVVKVILMAVLHALHVNLDCSDSYIRPYIRKLKYIMSHFVKWNTWKLTEMELAAFKCYMAQLLCSLFLSIYIFPANLQKRMVNLEDDSGFIASSLSTFFHRKQPSSALFLVNIKLAAVKFHARDTKLYIIAFYTSKISDLSS